MRKCVELAPLEEEEKKRILWKIKQAAHAPSVVQAQEMPSVAEDAPTYGNSKADIGN
jgi:hypothetical protein